MKDDSDEKGRKAEQLELPLKPLTRGPAPLPPVTASSNARRAFRLIRGEGKRRDETLRCRDDVARLLVSSAADMLLKRISPDQAHEIQSRVEKVMRLFERVNSNDPLAKTILKRELDALERIWREGQK